MDLELIIASAVAIIAVGLYVVALWVGDQRTISTLASASNLALALVVVVVGLACGLGLKLSVGLVLNPNNWLRAISNLIHQI